MKPRDEATRAATRGRIGIRINLVNLITSREEYLHATPMRCFARPARVRLRFHVDTRKNQKAVHQMASRASSGDGAASEDDDAAAAEDAEKSAAVDELDALVEVRRAMTGRRASSSPTFVQSSFAAAFSATPPPPRDASISRPPPRPSRPRASLPNRSATPGR